jgi:hypothetical protein
VRRALLRVKAAALVDEHRLARPHVAQHAESVRVHGDGLGGDHVFPAGGRVVIADDRRADAERIAEREHAVARDHRHHGVGAPQAAVRGGDRGEDRLRIEVQPDRGLLQLVRQHVHQHLGVGAGVDVPQVGAEHLVLQLRRVGEVAVVPQHDAEGRIDVERLRLGRAERRARGRIAHVPDAHGAGQRAHVAGAEHVAHHARRLVHVERAALGRNDARRVLPAMLEEEQPVVEELVDGRTGDDSQNPAHRRFSRCD